MFIIIPVAIFVAIAMVVLVAGWILTLLKPCRRCDHAWMFHQSYRCVRCRTNLAVHRYE
jgi:hypothetical protein